MVLNEFKHFIENPTTVTVPKEWGAEYHLENIDYCLKILELKQDFQCSLHYHKKKMETFLILSGYVQLEAAEGNYILTPGEKFRIYPGVEHRFTGLTDAIILEVSTHDDPEDSYRLELSKRVK